MLDGQHAMLSVGVRAFAEESGCNGSDQGAAHGLWQVQRKLGRVAAQQRGETLGWLQSQGDFMAGFAGGVADIPVRLIKGEVLRMRDA